MSRKTTNGGEEKTGPKTSDTERERQAKTLGQKWPLKRKSHNMNQISITTQKRREI